MHPSLQVFHRNQCTPKGLHISANDLESKCRPNRCQEDGLNDSREIFMTFSSTSENLVCVPITETSFDKFLRAITDAASVADAVELRVDYLTADDTQRVVKILSEPTHTIQKPLILTYRPQEQGGQRNLPFSDRVDFWRKFDGWKGIAYADLELDLVEH